MKVAFFPPHSHLQWGLQQVPWYPKFCHAPTRELWFFCLCCCSNNCILLWGSGWARFKTSSNILLNHWMGTAALIVRLAKWTELKYTLLVGHVISSIRINRITMGSCWKFGICTTTNALTLYSFPHYTFLWPEDGQQWPKHAVSLIKQIQRQLCFDVPTPS